MSIIGAEDEDFESDINDSRVTENQCAYFNNIELLKSHPTHLLVFLQHVILQFNPAPLLCYLHADLIKSLSAKETKKQFIEFYNNFLDKGAILKVTVPPSVAYELDRTRPDLLSDDTQRRFALEIQNQQNSEITKQLEDFRQKRMMGMTLNENELLDVESHYPTDRIPMEMKEKSMAENLLEKMFETQPQFVSDEEKWQSIFSSVAVYMKHFGIKSKSVDSKKSRRGFFGIPLVKGIKDGSWNKPGPFHKGKKPPNSESGPKPESGVEKLSVDRKSINSGRGSVTDNSVIPPVRVSIGSGSSTSVSDVENPDGSGSKNSATINPEPLQFDGSSSNRLEPQAGSDSGNVSPGRGAGELTIVEPTSPNETPSVESLETDRRKTRKVARSESARVDRHSSRRRGSSRAKQSRSRSDVDLQPPSCTTPVPLSPQHLHPFEALALNRDGPSQTPTSPSPQLEEIEPRLLEFEQDPPNWKELAPVDAVKSLSKKEVKRQEVINELFATEHAHVRMLSVLQMVFVKPLEREALISTIELDAIFPGLDEMLDEHYKFYENMKKLRINDNYIVKSISPTLLNRFDGAEGEWFQKLTARFSSHQTWALEQIKSMQKKEPRFNAFIQEAESKPQCRRLQLKDIIPTEMQRLTKYPLLLENIAKNTEDPVEKGKIQDSAECCKKIVNHVNEEVRKVGNMLSLKEYQKKLDTSGLKTSNELYTEYKNIDLTQRKMLYEGPLIWRVTKEKAIEVQGLLLGDLLVLLQKQDDKVVLKCQSKSNIAAQEGKQMMSPIIKLNSVFLRDVATDRKAFYVIFTWDSGAQIYELVAQSVGEKKAWTEVLKIVVDDLKKSGVVLNLPPGSGGAPFSPSLLNAPIIPAENGGLKSSSDHDRDSLTDDKSEQRHRLMDFLTEKGLDVLGHSNNDQEKVANNALDEVMSLKRLLIGSISVSEDAQPDEEHEEEQSERSNQETEGSQSTEEGEVTDRGYMEVNTNRCEREDAETKDEDGSISAPMVLSQEIKDEVCRRLHSLEEQLKKLQTVEEEHHKLQDALSEFSLEEGNF
ncbi:rho guanine nucleotide exchange factor 1b isoform X2 [Kryptolebias marmoratus]|uniref:rho guanine nucleotide exchange factor 1b isoform X2 n=1 Tax=Kryptolebias marmoratus TaxID=37003 RepID=UPI000D52FE55|nr:rho guanine nucleotide exchange factor 1b isoform X2 [Kryptolebias marmoratus]